MWSRGIRLVEFATVGFDKALQFSLGLLDWNIRIGKDNYTPVS
jgi:hypothetical protein